jgi:hypothetical protein
VKIVKGGKDLTTLEIVMTEGKKRQIRRVASILNHPVKRLVRTHIGKLALGTMRPGEWRELNANDISALQTPAMKLGARKPEQRRRAKSPSPERTDRPVQGKRVRRRQQ